MWSWCRATDSGRRPMRSSRGHGGRRGGAPARFEDHPGPLDNLLQNLLVIVLLGVLLVVPGWLAARWFGIALDGRPDRAHPGHVGRARAAVGDRGAGGVARLAHRREGLGRGRGRDRRRRCAPCGRRLAAQAARRVRRLLRPALRAVLERRLRGPHGDAVPGADGPRRRARRDRHVDRFRRTGGVRRPEPAVGHVPARGRPRALRSVHACCRRSSASSSTGSSAGAWSGGGTSIAAAVATFVAIFVLLPLHGETTEGEPVYVFWGLVLGLLAVQAATRVTLAVKSAALPDVLSAGRTCSRATVCRRPVAGLFQIVGIVIGGLAAGLAPPFIAVLARCRRCSWSRRWSRSASATPRCMRISRGSVRRSRGSSRTSRRACGRSSPVRPRRSGCPPSRCSATSSGGSVCSRSVSTRRTSSRAATPSRSRWCSRVSEGCSVARSASWWHSG